MQHRRFASTSSSDDDMTSQGSSGTSTALGGGGNTRQTLRDEEEEGVDMAPLISHATSLSTPNSGASSPSASPSHSHTSSSSSSTSGFFHGVGRVAEEVNHWLTPPGLAQAIREHDLELNGNSHFDPDDGRSNPARAASAAVNSNNGNGAWPSNALSSFLLACAFPKSAPAKRLRWLVLISIFLFLDVFIIRKPYGLITWHVITGAGKSQIVAPPSAREAKCGWDYEASWKVGLVKGSSPLAFEITDRKQPLLSCQNINHLSASFLADPFLFIPSNSFTEGHARLAESDVHNDKGKCDLSNSEPISATNTGEGIDFDGVPGSTAQCFSAGSFVQRGANIPEKEARSLQQKSDPWYMFYEIKNLGTQRGELGASVSYDHGRSFRSVGTILREKLPSSSTELMHLSYPQVFLAYEPGIDALEYYMIPETHQATEVRIYRADPCCFPFGWKVLTTKLTGQHFVDTTVIFQEKLQKWFIFTSVDYTLHLYMSPTASLAHGDWISHPASPLYVTNRHFGRNGGRIFPYDQLYYRWAQDCSKFYGEKLHMLRITTLNEKEFREEWVTTLKPSNSARSSNNLMSTVSSDGGLMGESNAGVVPATFLTDRIHHVDLQFIPTSTVQGVDSHQIVEGYWVGSIDGDNIPDDFHFWKREGWFWYCKCILFLSCTFYAIYLAWRNYILHLFVIFPLIKKWKNSKQVVVGAFRTNYVRAVTAWERLTSPTAHSLPSAPTPSSSSQQSCSQKFVKIAAVLLLSFVAAFVITDMYPMNMSCTTAGAHSGDALPRVYSYAQLAAKSPAYAESIAWKNGVEAKFGIELSAHVEDAFKEKQHKEEKTTGVDVNELLQFAVKSHQQTSRDSLNRPYSPRPSIWGSFATLVTHGDSTKNLVTHSDVVHPSVFLVTAATEDQFGSVVNLIGSIHFWWNNRIIPAPKASEGGAEAVGAHDKRAQPYLTSLIPPFIFLYDLGLTDAQLSKLQCMRYVRILRPQYNSYPAYVRIHATGVIAPYLLHEVLTTRSKELGVHDLDAVMYLAPDTEVRSGLGEVLAKLFKQGHFVPTVSGYSPSAAALKANAQGLASLSLRDAMAASHDIFSQTNKALFASLGVDSRRVLETPMCNSGMIGFTKSPHPDSPMHLVMNTVLTCAKDISCAFPPRTGSDLKSLSTSSSMNGLFSVALWKAGLACSNSLAYRSSVDSVNPDETLPSPIGTWTTNAYGGSSSGFTQAASQGGRKPTEHRFIPADAEGSTITFVTRPISYAPSGPYVRHVKEDGQDGVCVPAADGWISHPPPHLTLHSEPERANQPAPVAWFIPASRALDGSAASDELVTCVRGLAREPDQLRAACSREITAYSASYSKTVAAIAATSTEPGFVQSFSHELKWRLSCGWFWLAFTTLSLFFLSARLRQFLFFTKWRLCGLVTFLLFLFVWLPLYRLALNRWGTFAPWNAILYTSRYDGSSFPWNNQELISEAPSIDLHVDASKSVEPAFAVSRQAHRLPFPPSSGAAASSSSSSSSSSNFVSPPNHALTPSEIMAGPPKGWKCPLRVTVSFTTMPHHVDKLGETIDSLLAQSLVPDAIYLNLPRGRNRRTNQTYEVLPYLKEKYGNTVFKILRCDDVGPLTKLMATLDAEPDPQTIVITVDSDKSYHPDTIATLAWRSYHDPRAAFGLCGWSFFFQPKPMEVTPAYAPWLLRGTLGRSVDVLQAVCGNAYRRAFFADLELLRNTHPKCFTTDDLWIAGYLATRAHIKRVIINTPGAYSVAYGSIEPTTVSWKAADPAEWQLSTNNVKPGVDMACIRGVEQRLGPWRQIRNMEANIDSAYDQPERIRP